MRPHGRAQVSAPPKTVTLYLVTNSATGKTYAGVTNHANINRRLSEHFYAAKNSVHNGAFYRAIKKYGRNCFSIISISKYDNRQDAYAAEIKYIKNNKPKYNSTLGGDGARGHAADSRIAERNKELHLGNQYRLGKTHSHETRELLRKLAEQNIDKFKLYAALGPKSVSRKVICLTDGNVYESASAAARNYNVAKSALIELCLGHRGRKTVGGLQFEYVGGG